MDALCRQLAVTLYQEKPHVCIYTYIYGIYHTHTYIYVYIYIYGIPYGIYGIPLHLRNRLQ